MKEGGARVKKEPIMKTTGKEGKKKKEGTDRNTERGICSYENLSPLPRLFPHHPFLFSTSLPCISVSLVCFPLF